MKENENRYQALLEEVQEFITNITEDIESEEEFDEFLELLRKEL